MPKKKKKRKKEEKTKTTTNIENRQEFVLFTQKISDKYGVIFIFYTE